MRRKPRPADPDVGRVLAAGLSGVHPRDIAGWTLIIHTTDGQTTVTTDACCVIHAADRIALALENQAAAAPPCSGDPL